MAGRIVKDDVEALRRQADIVAVVGDYTTLKRAGRSFKGLCPFHTEKTPSFTVQPDGNFYHCFGCDASGDIYDFLMRIEGLEFPEAVEALARRSGVTLRYEQMSARERREVGQRSRLVAVTKAAQAFFTRQLFDADGTVARDYLKSRGFGRDEATTFDLGFASLAWDALTTELTGQGFKPQDILDTGLAVRNDRGGLRDRFRGRLMFPIHDPGGDVIGFGGRVLPELDYGDFDPPKYLNSSETPLYKKTRVLYGVPQARAEIVRADQVLICEGYTDVMALHQAGFANAVATCGTAVGVEHLRMVTRYTSRVVLAFDGDKAGVKAAERAWDAARELAADGDGANLDVRVLALDDGRDPADLVNDMGPDGMRATVNAAPAVAPFVLRHHLAGADLSSEQGRTTALRDAIGVLAKEPDLDLRREWARTEIADRVGLSYDFVARTAARQSVELDAHEGVAEVAAPNPTSGPSITRARAKLERSVLRCAVQHPQLLPDEWYELTEDDFTHPTAKALARTLAAAGGAGVAFVDVLAEAPDEPLRNTLRALALEDDPEITGVATSTVAAQFDHDVAAQVAAGRVKHLVAEGLQQRETQLRGRLARLNHTTDRDEVVATQRELLALQQRRRELTADQSSA